MTTDVRAFARANLPPPLARVLEVGAGSGELACGLTAAAELADASGDPRDRVHVRPADVRVLVAGRLLRRISAHN